MQYIKDFWNKNRASKIIIIVILVILFCCISSVFLSLISPSTEKTSSSVPTINVDAISTEAAMTVLADAGIEITPIPTHTLTPVVSNTEQGTESNGGFVVSVIIILFLLFLIIILVILYIKKTSEYNKIHTRFKDIIDIETEQKRIQNEFERKIKRLEEERKQREAEEKRLQEIYQKKKSLYKELVKEVNLYEEELELVSYGLYKPHFDFDSSERYKQEIKKVKQTQKELIRKKQAAICTTDWSVAGSKTEGKKMITRNIKLMLRAFNNECDAAILKVRWNNVKKMETRITKAFDAINKLGEPTNIYITRDYLNAKLKELYLTHEYQEKKHAEKEEQREIQAQIREEQRVLREAEKAKKEAEQEAKIYQKALEEARKELGVLHGDDLVHLQEQIEKLEEDLNEAQKRKERAISRAQLTKSGHVYVISNIGSFGEGVYKIGMTRRLEPMDRVKELGDASVPFVFDVHAIIYSEDAPRLEKELHNAFRKQRLNLVNNRKEFFRVSLEEIETIVHKNHADIEFIKTVEAREYRETLSIREKEELAQKENLTIDEKFPDFT